MLDSTRLLQGVPAGLREPLLDEYRGLVKAFAESRWKYASLDAGRFCEVVYSIIDGATSGTYPLTPKKPSRFVSACAEIERRDRVATGDHSLRVLIPRVLPGMYDIRNNRDVGHVGGDVKSNRMDAAFVVQTANWILCELVRVFHDLSVPDAQLAVDALAERKHPLVWERDGIRRVLDPDMRAGDRALVLLYGLPDWCPVATLQGWVKYKANFRQQVLVPLSDDLLIEFDEKNGRVVLTTRGIRRVEDILESREAQLGRG